MRSSWLFPCFLILTVIHKASLENICYNCNGVPEERDCKYTSRCGDHEKCYTKQITTDNGNIIYESGCMGNDVCRIAEITQGLGRKRSLTTCFRCCNGTNANGEICNIQQCTRPSTEKRVRCYKCEGVERPEDCPTVVTCDADEECGTHYELNQVSWRYLWRLSCVPKFVCDKIPTLHIPTHGACFECCNTSLCNRQQCGLAQLTKPELKLKPNDRVLSEGDIMKLECQAYDKFNATIGWSFESYSGPVSIPNTAKYGPKNESLTLTVLPEHSGNWTCTASNAVGSVSSTAMVTVVPHLVG